MQDALHLFSCVLAKFLYMFSSWTRTRTALRRTKTARCTVLALGDALVSENDSAHANVPVAWFFATFLPMALLKKTALCALLRNLFARYVPCANLEKCGLALGFALDSTKGHALQVGACVAQLSEGS